MNRYIVFISILSVTIALSACGSKESEKTVSNQPIKTSEQKSTSQPTEQPKLTVAATPTPSPELPKVDNSKKETDFKNALKKYVDENFGMEGFKTSWYDLIKDYKVSIVDKETVVSVIVSSSVDASKAPNITSTVLGFVNDQTQKEYRAQRVIVVTDNNKTIFDKVNPIK